MVIVQIGKGLSRDKHGAAFESHLGQLEAKVDPRHLPMTIKRLVRQLAKQMHITDGEIEVVSLNFVWRRAK